MVSINVSHLLVDGDGHHEETTEEGTGMTVSLYHVTVPRWLLEDSPLTEWAAPEAELLLTA